VSNGIDGFQRGLAFEEVAADHYTDNRTARIFNALRCNHPKEFKHVPIEGSRTPHTIFIPGRCVSTSCTPSIQTSPSQQTQLCQLTLYPIFMVQFQCCLINIHTCPMLINLSKANNKQPLYSPIKIVLAGMVFYCFTKIVNHY